MVDFLLCQTVVPASVLVFLFVLWMQTYSKDRKRTDWMTVAFVLALPANMLAMGCTVWLSDLIPLKYDLYLYSSDAVIGNPSFVVGNFLERHVWLQGICASVYSLCPLIIAALFSIVLWKRSEQEALILAKTFGLCWCLLPFLYLLYPACGPKYAFPTFPHVPVGPVLIRPVLLDAPPNAMPSGHFAYSILVCWFARHWWQGRVLASVSLIFTLLATIGSGEHYFIDLVVAIPYAMLVLKIGQLRFELRPVAAVRTLGEAG